MGATLDAINSRLMPQDDAHHEKQGVEKQIKSGRAPGVTEDAERRDAFHERRGGGLLGLLHTSRRKVDILCLGLAHATAVSGGSDSLVHWCTPGVHVQEL